VSMNRIEIQEALEGKTKEPEILLRKLVFE
jgi:hypothetical protein